MRLLVLGGTQFVGRHIVETALARGHELTLFNRGQTAASLFPQLECRRGDRRGDLSALASGEWDAVLDTCGYLPREVEASARLLAGRVGRYAYISSISAYASFSQPGDELSPLASLQTLADPDTEIVDGGSYGPLKAACEASVQHVFGDARSLLIRPGLVVGPHDATQRFTYWPARLAQARDDEPVLAPGSPQDGLQFIDARDLAAFVLDQVEQGAAGAYNSVAAPARWTRAELLSTCAAVAGTQPRLVWVDSATLLARGAKAWNELPLWLPDTHEYAGFMQASNAKALAAGLRIRPLAETVADTLAWWRSLPAEQQAFSRAGMSAEREAELLAGPV